MRPLPPVKPRRWDEIARRMPTDRAILGAEVGVWQGKMSEQLLRLLPNLRLYLVDRWCAPPAGDSYIGSGSKISAMGQDAHTRAYQLTLQHVAPYAERARVMQMTTLEAAARLAEQGKRFDFVFIDADHSYAGVRADLIAWRPLVRAGGWPCGHDYSTDPAKQGEVRRAVDEQFPEGVTTGVNDTWFFRL